MKCLKAFLSYVIYVCTRTYIFIRTCGHFKAWKQTVDVFVAMVVVTTTNQALRAYTYFWFF